MKKTLTLLPLLALITLLVVAASMPKYVGKFYGDGVGLTNITGAVSPAQLVSATNLIYSYADATFASLSASNTFAGGAYFGGSVVIAGDGISPTTVSNLVVEGTISGAGTNALFQGGTNAAKAYADATSAWGTNASYGLGGYTNVGNVGVFITNAAVAGAFSYADGTKYAQTNGSSFVLVTNGTITASGDTTIGGTATINGNLSAPNGTVSGYAIASQGSGYGYISIDGRVTLMAPAEGQFRIYTSGNGNPTRDYFSSPKALTDNSAIGLLQIDVFTNATFKSAFVGGSLDYTMFCSAGEGGEGQVSSGVVNFSAINTNGVFYNATATEVNQVKSLTSGTLTTVWALTPKSGNESTNINLTVTADTSLTPAAGKFYILWHARFNGTNTVTVL